MVIFSLASTLPLFLINLTSFVNLNLSRVLTWSHFSNAFPELVYDSKLGAVIELRDIENADRGLSPLEIWCNEAQERFVLAISPERLNEFKSIADRERSGYSIVGIAKGRRNEKKRLVVRDRELHTTPIDLPMDVLFGKPPRLDRKVHSRKLDLSAFDASLATYLPKMANGILDEAITRVLHLPAVASKAFLITIGDRNVGGLTIRDQMVGRHQVPVADVAVTATSLTRKIKTGEAMAMGEKAPIALIAPTASVRMAIAEALLNIAAADLLDGLERIRLSANWMSSVNSPGEAAALYEGVEAASEICRQLNISIPVGKDSTSMKTSWKDQETGEPREVTAPLSLIVSAFAPVRNIHRTWTPALRRPEEAGIGETILLMVDISEGHRALGGSALAQTFLQIGNKAPDVRNVQRLKDYFDAMGQLKDSGVVLAYHDISDGGKLLTPPQSRIMLTEVRSLYLPRGNDVCGQMRSPHYARRALSKHQNRRNYQHLVQRRARSRLPSPKEGSNQFRTLLRNLRPSRRSDQTHRTRRSKQTTRTRHLSQSPARLSRIPHQAATTVVIFVLSNTET